MLGKISAIELHWQSWYIKMIIYIFFLLSQCKVEIQSLDSKIVFDAVTSNVF